MEQGGGDVVVILLLRESIQTAVRDSDLLTRDKVNARIMNDIVIFSGLPHFPRICTVTWT